MNTTFQSIYPRLPVADLKASLAFYRKLFGFDPKDILETEGFAILHKDKIGIQLVSQSSAHPVCPTTVWIDCIGVIPLHDSKKDSFYIDFGPEVYSYGRREFCVIDPDKHRIIFSEPTSDAATCEG